MNQKALKSLEYYKIIDQLAEKASSPMGKDLCKHLLPSEDVYEIRHMQTQTRDALTRLRSCLLLRPKSCARKKKS